MNSGLFSLGRTRIPKGTELLLMEDPLALVCCFCEMKTNDTEALGEAIGHLFVTNRRSTDLLPLCASEEIFSTARAEQLLRQDSIYIAIIQQFIKHRGKNWLYHTLRKPLRRIIQSDYSLEIDKMRLSANEDLSINRENLEYTIRSILDPIFNYPEAIPPEIGALCRLLFQLTNEKFPGSGYKVLSGSLFLRFICPFIGSPKSWHLLTRQEIPPETRRKLVLVAKVVQGIANENTEFNELYMNQIKDLLIEYIEKLHRFHDRIIEIAPPFSGLSWSQIKEKKSKHTASVQLLKEFLKSNYTSIIQEIVIPLSNVYTKAELFGRRLELLLYDHLDQDQLHFLNDFTKEDIQKATLEELKDLRKARGKSIWEDLLEELRNSCSSHDYSDLSECKFYQLKFIVLPKNLYKIDNDSRGNKASGKKNTNRKNGVLRHSLYIQPNDKNDHSNDRAAQSLRIPGSGEEEEDTITDLSETLDFSDEDKEGTLYTWLCGLKLSGYYSKFNDNGFTEIQQLKDLTDEKLIEIGIDKVKIRRQLLASCNFCSPEGKIEENFIPRRPVKQRRKKKKVNSRRNSIQIGKPRKSSKTKLNNDFAQDTSTQLPDLSDFLHNTTETKKEKVEIR